MYKLLDAKLLIMPDWLEKVLEAHSLKPCNVDTDEKLNSILSAQDVAFYHKQITQLFGAVSLTADSITPVEALLKSTLPLHTNFNLNFDNGAQASGLNLPVKINALYGKQQRSGTSVPTSYENFPSLIPKTENMGSFLETSIANLVDRNKIILDPYVESCGSGLFVLKFSRGLYEPQHRVEDFMKNTLELLLGEYGFDEVSQTKLFSFYTLM